MTQVSQRDSRGLRPRHGREGGEIPSFSPWKIPASLERVSFKQARQVAEIRVVAGADGTEDAKRFIDIAAEGENPPEPDTCLNVPFGSRNSTAAAAAAAARAGGQKLKV